MSGLLDALFTFGPFVQDNMPGCGGYLPANFLSGMANANSPDLRLRPALAVIGSAVGIRPDGSRIGNHGSLRVPYRHSRFASRSFRRGGNSKVRWA